MPQTARNVKHALETKGFRESDERDHFYYFFFHNGKKTRVYTKISHGEREIHDKNCSLMARQIRLTGPQFRNFVDCPLTKEQYTKLLLDGKHIG